MRHLKASLFVLALGAMIALVGCDPTSPVCGDGVLAPSEECETDADCPGTSTCTASCLCLVHCEESDPCYGRGPGYPCTTADGQPGTCQHNFCGCCPTGSDECTSDDDCSAGYHCNTDSCMCEFGPGACPADSDGCTTNADCIAIYGAAHVCQASSCNCIACADVPGGCSTDAECEAAYGPEYFCNLQACNCYTCPEDSVDQCRTDAECQEMMGDPTAYCHLAFCECALPCPEGSPCDHLIEGYTCTTAIGETGVCQDCVCVVDPCADPECTTDDDCPIAYFCRPDECWCDHIVCGDGHCSPSMENSDLCPEDCECVDDGECSPGEGAGCLDCSEGAGRCNAPCETSEQCVDGFSCFNGVCWNPCECAGDCEPEEGGEEEPTCRPCQTAADCGATAAWQCVNNCCVSSP